jgi:hypothetical protein
MQAFRHGGLGQSMSDMSVQSGTGTGFFPLPCQHHCNMTSPCSYISRGINNRPVGGRSPETWSHHIDMYRKTQDSRFLTGPACPYGLLSSNAELTWQYVVPTSLHACAHCLAPLGPLTWSYLNAWYGWKHYKLLNKLKLTHCSSTSWAAEGRPDDVDIPRILWRIIVFINFLHWSLSLASWTHSTHILFLNSILKLSFHLRPNTVHRSRVDPARNASLVAVQGSARGTNVRYYPTWKHSPLKERNEQGCYNA